MTKVKEKMTKSKKTEIVGTSCNDVKCHVHGHLKLRGKIFDGTVIKKFPKRVAIEFERMVYIRKYERYSKSKTKIHARLPVCMEKNINVGDLIRVQECRPLSKIIHFAVIGKVEEGKK
ncbi:MAG TPA: 30S ribosomal protein S17 [Candidatus Nanoarchaeia archaeon]|nr:30S ribosomal protein S17 [Candidatus Nanoarchaeia archaeon]